MLKWLIHCFYYKKFIFTGPLYYYSFGTLNLSVYQHAAPLILQTPELMWWEQEFDM